MKVVMKRGEVFSLATALHSMRKEFGYKVAYAISKNKKTLRDEIEATDEAVKPSPEYEEYDKERVEIAKKHSRRDAAGAAITKKTPLPNGGFTESFDIINLPAFEVEHTILKEKYKDAVEAQDKKIKDRNDSLAEEVEMEFHGIESTLLDDPKFTFSQTEMDALMFFIIEVSASADKPDVSKLKSMSAVSKKRT